MTTFLTLLAVWVIGWAAGARIALTNRMNTGVCKKGFDSLGPECHGPGCRIPLGQLRERNLTDACAALGTGLAWPVLLAAALLSATTPATPGEATRRLAEQQHRIKQQADTIAQLTADLERTR